jgi:sortase B
MAKKKVSNKKSTQTKRRIVEMLAKRRTILFVCIAVITTMCAAWFAVPVIRQQLDMAAIQREQEGLPDIAVTGAEAGGIAPNLINPHFLRLPESVEPSQNELDAQMREANDSYIGWLKIEGTTIDLPVVRGRDNVRFLNTTFGGATNSIGAIFADYRNVGEYVPHIIIYGHNAEDTDGNRLMFGGLHYFLDDEYRAAHPTITLMTNDTLAEFEVFAARFTDTTDPAYYLEFSAKGSFQAFLERINAPPDATQIITLSTCVGVGNDDRRMIVQGALSRIVPIIGADYGENGWTIRVQE